MQMNIPDDALLALFFEEYLYLIWDVKGDTGISFLKPYVGIGFGADKVKEKLNCIVCIVTCKLSMLTRISIYI